MMWDNDSRPLPDCIEKGYQILLDHIDDPREGINKGHVSGVLVQAEEFPDEPADVEYGIDQLLNRGYFYEVEVELRVTEPDTDEELTAGSLAAH